MSHHLLTGLILIVGLIASAADAQAPPGRAYKVAFWYELDRPWSTTQYRAYDLSKGEYNAEAVDRWQKTIFAHHPGTGCCVRDLSTAGMPGDTEAERLQNAVELEKQRWADLNKNPSRPFPSLARSPSPIKEKDHEVKRVGLELSVPGWSGTPMYPSRSPFPYPYRSGPR